MWANSKELLLSRSLLGKSDKIETAAGDMTDQETPQKPLPKQLLIVTPSQSLGKREWLAALIVALSVTLVIAVPYMLGYVLSGAESEFTGLIMNPEDSNSYFAKMLQGYNGHWLYKIPFTSEEHDAAFLGGFYLLMGHLSRLFGISLDLTWHLSRALFGVLLFMTSFFFIAGFLPDRRERWTAYLLTILGSGLGWLLFIAGQTTWLGAFPIDFKMPEAHLFFTALAFPHVALGTTLLMISFYFLLLALQSKEWTFILISGLANLAIGIAYPFLIYLVALTSGIYWASRAVASRKILWKEAGTIVLPLIITAPLYIYYAYTYQINDVYRSWAEQAVTESPPFPHYLVSYGPLILLALLPVLKRKRTDTSRGSSTFLWTWVIAALILIYAPINPQRRFVQGVQVPLTILATIGLFKVGLPWLLQTKTFKKLAARPRYSTTGLERLSLMALISFMAISNIYILGSTSVTTAIQQPFPFFRSLDETEAVEWLRANGEQEGVVFSAYETGNYIASHAGNPVWVGHWAETVGWADKIYIVEQFFSASSNDRWRQQLLEQHNINYVWHGALEKQVGDFEPDQAQYLNPVYRGQYTTIYKVEGF